MPPPAVPVPDEPPRFDAPTAAAALVDAARAAGLPAARPRLIRLGSNAVFELGPLTVGRVAPAGADGAGVRRSLAVARWLRDQGFPAVRPLPDASLDVVQPVDVRGHLVTFWESAGTSGRPGTTRQLGELLHRFHALPATPGLGVPAMDPAGRAERQLAAAPVAPDDARFLRARLADVVARYRALTFPLGEGLLHGDATVANVLAGPDGRPVLLDLDLVRTGPREWDLLRTATYFRRLGWHTAAEYEDFCAGYGADVTAWEGFDVTADLAELLQVGWLADAAARRPDLAAELGVRIATLRSGASRRSWRAV